MSETLIATFANRSIATASATSLAELGINCINQDSTMIQFSISGEQWITVYEVVCSFGGDIVFTSNDYEVINKMYHIPEESFENDESPIANQTDEVGAIGYPYDQLDDNAFIDPNIGIGNQDLLIPFIEQSDESENTK